MDIVSVIPECFQEFENEVSLGLFCAGCNLSCKFCYNLNVIRDKTKIVGEAKDLFFRNINPMHTALVVSGGEPTIWAKDLFELLTIAKGAGLKTKVFSNAIFYDVIQFLNAYKLVDMYSFDVKAATNVADVVRIPISDEEYCEDLFITFRDCKRNNVPFEIRVTKYPGIDIPAIQTFLETPSNDFPIIWQDYKEYGV